MKALSVNSINESESNSKKEKGSAQLINAWAKRLVLKRLQRFTDGSLLIEDGDELHYFGENPEKADTKGHIVIHRMSVYRDLLLNGTTGSGESYMRGEWESPDLVNVIRIMCQNLDTLYGFNSGWSTVSTFFSGLRHRLRINNKKNSKRNISAHYDLGNDFFSLFLDKSMMYSSAIYPSPETTLEDASNYKLDHVCQRLRLTPDDHLLEIGTGWGGMAIYAAKYYGCKVTTTTISKEQHSHAVSQVKAAGLQDKITVLLDDYRDLEGQFDKLVSIEMIEAVGPQYYSDYFSTCSRLLKKEGLMLIQAITMPDQRYTQTSDSADFIQLYIFPGGHLPCPSVMAKHVAKDTDMQIVGIEDITIDYALTIKAWRQRFFDKLPHIKSLGYDDIFIRMWDFYLSYCEGGFRERTIGTMQMLIAKPRCLSFPTIR
ncbi:MAG: cyclopropane-fatty-acyl-phospholipid synthase [Cellvibrionaceae bacterium]|jgi:cyclopropane-fatty-acyl-phospholipid synthase